MKIAVTGKGGSGKTTIAAGLSLIFSKDNKEVVAVDCDPDANLGLTLGIPGADNILPICEMKELIASRTGVEAPEKPAAFFKLNPKVDDIPEKFSVKFDNIRLLVMGKVAKASGGCMCPENAFIKSLISHLVLSENQIVILDMVAGSEHLGRGTAKAVDAFLVVVEPTQISLSTAIRIKKLTEELAAQDKTKAKKKIYFVGNKIQTEADRDLLRDRLNNDILGFISYSKALEAGRGRFVFDEALQEEFKDIYEKIKS